MSSEWVSYFGYGSLVNRQTRPDGEIATNATLNGWQRVWGHRVMGDESRQACTSLSVERAQDSIEGVLVSIRSENLPTLDRREHGYERLSIDHRDLTISEPVTTTAIYMYRSLEQNQHFADKRHPIVQSYVDCVMAGYLDRFGETGLLRFLNTTRGWDRPIIDDRHNPLYPRSIQLPDEKHKHFDALLTAYRTSPG